MPRRNRRRPQPEPTNFSRLEAVLAPRPKRVEQPKPKRSVYLPEDFVSIDDARAALGL